jgi:hypothetical protein
VDRGAEHTFWRREEREAEDFERGEAEELS